ncbi:hypothetical protein FRC05_002004 [Tulasnella sp. 425]|nr:hypothetical protein FRC05_002004 [Tulasnella sp. 425]
MAEIAARHHENLQARPEMTDERKEAIKEMVAIANQRPITTQAKAKMARDSPTENDVEKAIRASQNGKAPGKDGILYEFYKKWLKYQGENSKENSKEKFPCITFILMRVWNASSRSNGAPPEYIEGLMTFQFKKGDKREIGNYRPITLLNTDYKLETKFLATSLAENVTMVIHEDQAGFVPGRDIADHIKLAQVVEEYCETAEINGCLVALDQEKAYDRIDHEYIWRIL